MAPVYNEEGTIEEFYARVCAALDGLPFELVLVDDGSSDGSPMQLTQMAHEDPRVRVVQLSRNFGHQTALTAGLDHAAGDPVVMLDADLQDPPELIPTMLDHWRAGCDVVYAVREHRAGESRFKLSTARWFYRLFDKLAQVELQHNSGDFRLLDRRPLDALLSMRERNRFLRGMTVWVGYTQAAVPYQRDARYAGETKYTLSEDAAVLARRDLVVLAPARCSSPRCSGFMISTLAFIAIPVVVVLRILGSYLPGFSALTIVVLLLGGIELIAIGIIGEYVGRIYDEVKGRPLYLVRARHNLPDPEGRRKPDYEPDKLPLGARTDSEVVTTVDAACSTRLRRWSRSRDDLRAAIACRRRFGRFRARPRGRGVRARACGLRRNDGRDRRRQRHRCDHDRACARWASAPATMSSSRRSPSTPAPRRSRPPARVRCSATWTPRTSASPPTRSAPP